MELKGSETEKCLMKAFAGESQARNRYTFFASEAKKEGYEQISAIFTETADNEKEHAKIFFKYLNKCGGDTLEITASFPSGIISETSKNLEMAANGEHEEWTVLYPEFAKIAKEEGFNEIAKSFNEIAKIEQEHEKRYLKLLQNIQDGKVFFKEKIVVWKCRNCGYIHVGTEAPEVCPACNHPKAYYEIQSENY